MAAVAVGSSKQHTEAVGSPLNQVVEIRVEKYESSVRANTQYLFNSHSCPFSFFLDGIDDFHRPYCIKEVSLYIMWMENRKLHEDFHYIQAHVPQVSEMALTKDLIEVVYRSADVYKNEFGFHFDVDVCVWFPSEPKGFKHLKKERTHEGLRIFVHRPNQIPSIFSYNNFYMIPADVTLD